MISEQTLILVKPDGVKRGLVGEVIARVERKGYKITNLRSGPIVAMVAEGERVIEGFRKLAGATDPTTAEPGTIRGDLARDQGTKVVQNIVHGSDSPESANREIKIFFNN